MQFKPLFVKLALVLSIVLLSAGVTLIASTSAVNDNELARNQECDLDGNGMVDIDDLTILLDSANFGKKTDKYAEPTPTTEPTPTIEPPLGVPADITGKYGLTFRSNLHYNYFPPVTKYAAYFFLDLISSDVDIDKEDFIIRHFEIAGYSDYDDTPHDIDYRHYDKTLILIRWININWVPVDKTVTFTIVEKSSGDYETVTVPYTTSSSS